MKGLGFEIGCIVCILLVFSFLQLCQVLRVGFSSVFSDGSETWISSRGHHCGNVLALHGAIPVGHVLQPRTQLEPQLTQLTSLLPDALEKGAITP